MLGILFKVYFLLNAEVFQENTAVFSILFSLIRLLMQETSTEQNNKNYIDVAPKTI